MTTLANLLTTRDVRGGRGPTAREQLDAQNAERDRRRDAIRTEKALRSLPIPIVAHRSDAAVAPIPFDRAASVLIGEQRRVPHRLATGLSEALRRMRHHDIRVATAPKRYLTTEQLVQVRKELAGHQPRVLTRAGEQVRETSPLQVTAAQRTPREAQAALREIATDIRHRAPATLMQAMALAAEQRPDLARDAGMAGAGMASLEAWMPKIGMHAVGCQCGQADCYPMSGQ